MTNRIEELEARLAEVTKERDSNRALVNIAYTAGYYQAECGLPENPDAKKAAEATNLRFYRAGIEAAATKADTKRKQATLKGRGVDTYRDKGSSTAIDLRKTLARNIRALPDPTDEQQDAIRKGETP